MIMTDIFSSVTAIDSSITDVVSQFLEMASGNQTDHSASGTRQADLMYELDSLVSDFLDQNQISSKEYNVLEQQVLNSVAEELILKSEQNDVLDLTADDQGNYDAESVMAALDLDLSVVADFNDPSMIVDGFNGP